MSKILIYPFIALVCAAHFLTCVALMVFVHPSSKRKEIYEYYAPWGWGEVS